MITVPPVIYPECFMW